MAIAHLQPPTGDLLPRSLKVVRLLWPLPAGPEIPHQPPSLIDVRHQQGHEVAGPGKPQARKSRFTFVRDHLDITRTGTRLEGTFDNQA